ncbi:NADPH-dependent oxidoreductase [Planomicrobium sp. CPCC 101079]|uniref:NADPH-dependent oxidoreductase n=1 Tax=Planomicrobium sp. CPCC 101079 TaxID=2599618 RepID=UPI0011B69948|nr:NADPH-dependent oxidoreductase [Planomicrobium sp. CPCC 101079]TWT03634.1 NADPH-dependent oxidoreductase [Planomicrobium sp. CPCC 101079]
MEDDIIRNRMKLEELDGFEEWNETLNVLTSHESIRAFQSKNISEGMLEAIIMAARSAPTSSNLQAYSIVVVADESRKEKLAGFSGNQKFIKEAPIFLVFCADVYRLKHVTKRQGYEFKADTLEMFLLASMDAALTMENALIAAESLGLGAVPVGSIRNEPLKVAAELALPKGVFALVGLAIGYEKEGTRRGVKPRLPKQVTVHKETYSTEGLEDGLNQYDRQLILRKTYDGRRVSIAGEPEREGVDYGWAEHTARRCTRPETIAASASLRENLKAVLEEQGFTFK